ncbi:RloB domain-containing protein [Acanthopleuribacter pedis]
MRKTIVIAVEGQKDEVQYFEALRAHLNHHCKLVIARAQERHDPSPMGTFRRLHAEVHKNRRYHPGHDQFWMVVDRDRYHRQGSLQQAVTHCIEAGYQMAVSNPSFDLWLVFHFENPTRAMPKSIKKYRKHLMDQAQIHDFSGLMQRLNTAMAHARATDNGRDPWPQQPGSHVYKLVESLVVNPKSMPA